MIHWKHLALLAALVLACLMAFMLADSSMMRRKKPHVGPDFSAQGEFTEWATPTESIHPRGVAQEAEIPAPQGLVVFSVTDSRGEPAAGATVLVARENSQLTFNTGEVGLVDLDTETVASSTVVIRHSGHASHTLNLPSKPSSLYEVQLSEGARISGRATMIDGQPVPPDTRVFAWLEGAEMSMGPAAALYPTLGGRYSVNLSADGSFVVSGLKNGARYGLTIYGNGVVVLDDDEPRFIEAPKDGLALQAYYLYGARLIAAPEADAPQLINFVASWLPPAASGEGAVFRIDAPQGYHHVHPHAWGVSLAGLTPASYPRSALPRSVFLASPSGSAMSVPARAEIIAPCGGSNLVDVELYSTRHSRELHEHIVGENMDPDLYGSLALDMNSPGARFELASIRRTPPRIRLLAVSASPCMQAGDVLILNARWSMEEGAFLAPVVPEGNYRVWLTLPEANINIPSLDEAGHDVQVRPGELSRIWMRPPPLGTLHIDTIHGPDGKYSGAARVVVCKPSGRIGSSGNTTFVAINPDDFVFDRPPYEMGPFLAGEYNVRCYVAGGIAEPPNATPYVFPFPVTIAPGENWFDVDRLDLDAR